MWSLLQRAEELAKWVGLTFNSCKYGTLSCNRSGRHFVAEDTYQLDGQALPTLKYEDHYKYLGGDLGANPKAHLQHLSQSYMTKVKAIAESHLAEWQKLEAIQRLIRPILDYIPFGLCCQWRNGHVTLTITPDKSSKRPFTCLKLHALQLYIMHRIVAAWTSCAQLMTVWVSQTFKFLTNKHIHVKSVAVEKLRATVKARARCSAPTAKNTLQFLDTWRETPTYQSDIRSLWSILPWSCWLPNSWRVKRTWSPRWMTSLPQ